MPLLTSKALACNVECDKVSGIELRVHHATDWLPQQAHPSGPMNGKAVSEGGVGGRAMGPLHGVGLRGHIEPPPLVRGYGGRHGRTALDLGPISPCNTLPSPHITA